MAYAYYVYYRVEAANAATCEARVLELFTAMQQATGVVGKLLKKRSEPLLWMEVYENVRDDAKFELELKQAVTQLKLSECLQSDAERRVECFEA